MRITIISAIINLRPQHPSTHGVLRLTAVLHGEIIQWISTEIGLLHRGTEKLIECNYYTSALPYFDRFDYVSTITQELLFIHALERLIGTINYAYSSIFRTLFSEFYRIMNHCLAITTHAIDIGLFSTMLWSFEEREKLLHFTEVLSGTRFHAAFLLIGRLRYDISIRWIDSFIYWLMGFIRKLKELHNILSMNRLWRSRLYEIGMIQRDFILYFGFSGILARASNIKLDARFLGYEFYSNLDYNVFIAYNGDCLDRYCLRFNEMIESCRIMYSLIYIMLKRDLLFHFSSSYSVTPYNSGVIRNPEEYMFGFNRNSVFLMEMVILDFFSKLPFILSLVNEFTLGIESSKGIYSIFINSFPIISLNIVFNDFLVINQLNKFCRYINIGDLIAVLGSVDFVLGSVDL